MWTNPATSPNPLLWNEIGRVAHTLVFMVAPQGIQGGGACLEAQTYKPMSAPPACKHIAMIFRNQTTRQRSSVGEGFEAGMKRRVNVEEKEARGQRAVLGTADAMSSLAARSLGTSPSVMRPTSPYLKVPPLAHCTTSPMPCFLVAATRGAAVRNSLRSWLKPELPRDPLPLLPTVGDAVPLTGDLADPLPPFV